jgi:hypothetical protein
VSVLVGSSLDLNKILNYLPSAGDIYSDFQAEKPKQTDKNVDGLDASAGKRQNNFNNPFKDPKSSPGPYMSVSALQTPSKTPPKTPMLDANQFSGAITENFTVVNGKKFLNTVPLKYSTNLYRKIDFSNLDYILVTHLDKSQALALPILIKDLGFKGEILMTLPCRQIGTDFIREFYQMNERRVEKGFLGEGF